MNHHYPDNYHGYVRGAAGMQNMGYSHGSFDEQMRMGQMGHPRNNYQMPQYRDSGQVHPMMQQQPQQQSNMYPSGGYMNQMSGGASYGMSGYPHYGMANQANMNASSAMMMGPRGNAMGGYYNHHADSQTSPHPAPLAGPNSSYTQSTSGNSMHCPSQMNHMPTGQNNSHSQGGPLQQGGQASHSSSPLGISATHSNTGFQGQGTTGNQAMCGVQGQQRSVAGNRSGSNIHPIPQHPMRQPTTQQNPQEVADSILQIASSYPTNQTVQVPLKSRHAPYHIPRSPHYSISSSDQGHSSPMAAPSQQASPVPQPSPTPSSSSVKSPTPSLAPIPNPIPSPGITGLRSPCNQGAQACGTQRSPSHMASNYSGHSQPSPSPHHFSPTSMGNQQTFSSFTQSPTASRNAHASYDPSHDPNIYSNSDNQDLNPSYSSPLQSSASPHSHNMMPSGGSSSNVQFDQQGKGNNPLMSLQKLVMLPETQVVDPKSVVNDACMSSQSNENEEASKNGEDPAEGCAESSDSSVGCSGQSSSHIHQPTEQKPVTELNQHDSETEISDSGCPPARRIGEKLEEAENSDSVVKNDAGDTGKDENTGNSGLDEEENGVISTKLTYSLKPERATITKDINSSVNGNDLKAKSDSDCKNSTDECLKQLENSKDLSESLNSASDIASDIKSPNEEGLSNIDNKTVKQKSASDIKSPNEEGMSNIDNKTVKEEHDNILHSLKRKNGKVNGINEDVKQSLQCRSPAVLSEVPLLINGVSTSGAASDCPDQDVDGDVERKLQNGFSSRLRSKLRMNEKSGQFVRLTTPCSIAVGADERAVCERFVFRRNEYCHTLRTSRLLCNSRIRQDSTGNGDSDESIENVSDGNFHALGNPQDGCKKKSPSSSANSDAKSSSVNRSTHVDKKNGLVSQKGQKRNTSNGHMASSSERKIEASDEDAEVCYYEGVDSSDFFMNTVSSDESISSSQEVKQSSPKNSSTSPAGKDQNSSSDSVRKEISQGDVSETLNENLSNPPPKRLRKSSGQKEQESAKGKCSPSRCSLNNSNKETELINDLSCWSDSSTVESKDKNSPQADCIENGTVTRSRVSRRKQIFPPKENQLLNEQLKLPEAVVRLEKSPVTEKTQFKLEPLENPTVSVKIEKINPIVIDDSSPEKLYEDLGNKGSFIHDWPSGNVCSLKEEDRPQIQGDEAKSPANTLKSSSAINTKPEATGSVSDDNVQEPLKTITKKTFTSKKKTISKKGKKKMSAHGNRDSRNEVKDSFKSMKFGRTLDMIKSQKKKGESCNIGPFIRIEGNRSAPNTVSVFNQSSQEVLPVANKQKHNHRQSNSRNLVSATVHMVSNLSNDRTVMVSSTKFVQNQQWSCAFCSHHSSFQNLGDLFGPYFKEGDLPLIENMVSEESKKGDSNRDSPKSSNTSTAKQSKTLPCDKKGSRKRKLSGKSDQNVPQEIWLHEACAVWAPGVFLIGNRIYGLDDAIRDAAETICSVCSKKGAMIGCLFKGCAMKYHFACTIENECCLDEGNFSLLCPKHKDKKFNTVSSSSADRKS